MKIPASLCFGLVALLGFAAGCSHIEVASEGDPNRVLTGTVKLPTAAPAGSEVVVRLIDTSGKDIVRTSASNGLQTPADRPPAVPIERIVAESRQVIGETNAEAVPFRLEYRASDSDLRHGLNIDVRVLRDGRLRFRTMSAHVITLRSAANAQEIWVEAVR